MRHHVPVLAAIALLPTTLVAQQTLGRNERNFELTRMVPNGAEVRLYGVTGDLTVTEGASGRVVYRAEKRERDGNIDDIGFKVVSDNTGITICAVYEDDDSCRRDGFESGRRRGYRWGKKATVRVTVEVPKGVRLHANSGNGDVSVSVAARELYANSGNGDVRISQADGPVKAASGNGDVIIKTSRGPVTASTGNGDVHVEMDRLSDDSDMEFSSGNGDVIVTVPSDLKADLTASTGNGRIHTDLPIQVMGEISKHRLRGTINGGGRRLRMSSGNGEIELRRRP